MEGIAEWTLDELVRLTGLALDGTARPGASSSAPNGRRREVPNHRVIRWYTTTGLVDRPLGGRGRGARYGPRQLRQLVAIKRLQARGLTLAEIQARLAGIDDGTLAALAQLPADLLATGLPALVHTAPAEPIPATSARFWVAAPAAVVAPVAPVTMAGLRLPGGVLLVLPAESTLRAGPLALTTADLTDLAQAARPLLDLLAQHGLTDPIEGAQS